MVDIHCHILPGLDDGAKDMQTSLSMAQAAIEEGITHVVGTPHASSEYTFNYPKVRQLHEQLQRLLGDRLQLATGCDFHVNLENIEALRVDAPRFCINQQNYLLVEFSEYSISPTMNHTLHDLQLMGVRPIITHPERNPILQGHPGRLAAWIQIGCFGQVTAGSLTGGFGPKSREDALRWIGEGLIHFVASDAHNMSWRPLTLRPAFEVVRERFGEETARGLFVDNPLAAFEGRELPYVPEIALEEKQPKKKKFLFFGRRN
jgi:protein-tyrosine phosphatase